MDEAEQLCDRIAIIDEGKIIGLLQETGGTADMASNIIHDFTNQNLVRDSNFRVFFL